MNCLTISKCIGASRENKLMYVSSDALYHHGIKGQRWGVRRFQNKDGSLTAAGRRRYDVDIEGAKQRVADAKVSAKLAEKAYNRKSVYGLITTKNTKILRQQADKAKDRVQYEKNELKSERIIQKLNSKKGNSHHRIELEKHYRSKGMSEQEAAIAAYKRAKTEKIIAATAAVGIAAAATYVAYRHYDRSVDKFIKSDTLMKRITTSDSTSVRDAFYASLSKSDSKQYVGHMGYSLSDGFEKDVFQKSIRVNQPLRVASEKSATTVLKDLIQNRPEYARQLQKDLESTAQFMNSETGSVHYNEKQRAIIKRGIEALKSGKVNSDLYTAFNMNLNNPSTSGKEFYDHIRSKGYDAISDINDKRLSGLGTRTPTIVFNSGKTTVENVRKIGKEEIERERGSDITKTMVKPMIPGVAGVTGLGIASTKVKNVSLTRKQNKIVSEYIREHPTTDLTYDEIIRNYYNN